MSDVNKIGERVVRCPACGGDSVYAERNPYRPFCSARCKGIDFGGCRCQAFLLTGDAGATDPVCSRSPDRPMIDTILAAMPSEPPELVMRKNTIKVV